MAANIVRRKAKDGRIVLFDADTKQSLGYEEAPLPQQSPEVSDEPAGDSFSDKLNTILQHGAQGAAVGFGDELAGLTEAAGQVVGLEGTGGPIKDIGISKAGPSLDLERLKQAYERGKARQLEIFEQTAQENPVLATAADIAGGIVSPLTKVGAVGSAAAKLAPIIGKAAPLAKYAPQIAEGAVLGAIEGAGRADTDNTPTGSIIGGLLGGAGGAIVGKLGSMLKAQPLTSAAESLEASAANDALASIGGTSKDFRKEFSIGGLTRPDIKRMKGIGSTLLNKDIVGLKGGLEDVISKIDPIIERQYKKIGKISDVVQQKMSAFATNDDMINVHNLLLDTFEGLKEKAIKATSFAPDAQSVVTKVEDVHQRVGKELVKAIAENDFKKILEIKKEIGKLMSSTDWLSDQKSLGPLYSYYKELYGTLRRHTEDIIDVINPKSAKSFKDANNTLSNLFDARMVAFNKVTKDLPKTGLSFGDYTVSGLGMALGGPMGAIGSLAAKKGIEHSLGKKTPEIIRTVGALGKQQVAKGLQKLADSPEALQSIQDVLQKVPGKAPLVGGALTPTESPETVREPFNESLSDRLRSGSSDDLLRDAASLEQNFGESGAMFAEDLRKVAQGSKFERTTTAFKLMSNPAFKEMMRELKIRE